MIMNKYCNYVRKFMWQLCEWDRVDICMTFHKRSFDFLIAINIPSDVMTIITTADVGLKSELVERGF
jgi:hypothetical protein